MVYELSSFQLWDMKKSPHIAVIGQLEPDHLNVHKDYADYLGAKANITKYQDSNDYLVYYAKNSETVKIAEGSHAKKVAYPFNVSDEIKSAVNIPGVHNLENAMGAIMIAKEFDVSNDVIDKILSDFTGVEHRLEYVATVNGVRYYNDTEATNIKCTQIALSSFDCNTTIILGGLERGQNFDDLIPYMKHVTNIIGIGQCRDRVKEFGDKLNIPTYIYEKLEDGFKKSVEVSKDGVVLLSPASASWDQYKECEIRGAEFKKYVGELS